MADRETAYLTADVVALSDADGVLHVLLIRRVYDPHAGMWALPGGHVDPGEDVQAAAFREFAEETGLHVVNLRPVVICSDPGRDPRGRYVSFAYATYLSGMPTPTAGDDADAARWVPVTTALADGLAFDHADILRDTLTRR
ncbi:NUDIX domain-containing protein [Pseudofrankia asymbiotica]|uniref:Nudix hydrolase domain-containing protein n=1 Tax=Pseudofrankia asymbiotica TaxID=1834516 RepID=A0A1V2I1Y1_9ACTN|nr:NUDIX hydrolase [Pseudofrankia asymbiotica]ONH23831.1 hypothetical protein BL253_31940 [Pseudofrankia asymbiotica]